jgi:signal transduction histidine kinase
MRPPGRWARDRDGSLVRRWNLRQRITALVATAVAVLLVIAVLAAAAAAVSRSRMDTLAEINPIRIDAERLLAVVIDQETAIRGYALNQQEASLAPYSDGVAREREIIAEMRRRLPGDRGTQDRLRMVEGLTSQWRAQVAEPTISAVRAGAAGAEQVPGTTAARQLFDEVRAAIVALQDYLAGLRGDLAGQATRASNLVVALLVAAAAVVLAAGAILMVLLRRMVIAPVTALAGQVRAVAGGEYQREIRLDASPELAALAADVDAMRRKIAADLADVQAARGLIEDANRRLEEQTAELTRSNRDLEQFAYVASHDLQEPLRKVASFCQLLKRRYAGQLDERADQYINFAVDGAQRMQRLINDLLAFSRIGRVTTGFTEVDLDRLMSDTVAGLDTQRERTGAEITWSDLPVVRGEEALLSTLLANLVGNSLKFRRPGVPPRVRVFARRIGGEWEFTCQDNGIGIEPEFAEKVFVIFQRLHSKDAYPGTGIGLAIAKRIVEYHGGRIWVDPEYAEGAAIHFTLPAALIDATAPAGSAKETVA